MNLIKEINAYYKLDMPGQLSFTAQSLYMALLHIANEIYSRDISPSNPLLMAKTGIRDVKTLEKARQELIDLELITYQSNAKSRLAGKYHIIGLEGFLVDNFQKNTGKIPGDTPEKFLGSSGKKPPHIQEENREEENSKPPNPPKKTKPEKQAYAEYVFLTPAEHERLIAKYGEDDTSRMIEILDNYIGQNPKRNSKRYSDHNRVLRGWVLDKLNEEKAKQPKEKKIANF